jgi:hypothetical protein
MLPEVCFHVTYSYGSEGTSTHITSWHASIWRVHFSTSFSFPVTCRSKFRKNAATFCATLLVIRDYALRTDCYKCVYSIRKDKMAFRNARVFIQKFQDWVDNEINNKNNNNKHSLRRNKKGYGDKIH